MPFSLKVLQSNIQVPFAYYVHPTEGRTYYFCLFRRPASHFVSSHFKEKCLSYLYKIGMGVYWVNGLHGIAFGEDSSKAN